MLAAGGGALARVALLWTTTNLPPYLTFYPAVIIAALFGGVSGGTFAVVFSALLAHFAFGPFTHAVEWLTLAVFAISSGFIVCMTEMAFRNNSRAAAKKATHELDARLSAIVQSSADAIASKTVDGTITSWNAGATLLFGYSSEETIGKPITLIIPPDHLEEENTILARIKAGERIKNFDTVRRDKNGRDLDVSLTISPIRDAAGLVIGASKIIHDISERKRGEQAHKALGESEAALRESEEKFRLLANAIPQLAWIAHPDGYIYWYNQRWYEYTGTTPEQMEGWGWKRVHDQDVLPAVLERWTASIATGKPFDMTFPLRRADGQLRPFLTRIMPLLGSDGRVLQWFGTNTEIAEQKEMEEALRRARVEAERANLAKSKFLAAASHDLRQPAQSLTLLLEVIKRQVADKPKTVHAVNLAKASMESLNGMLTGILDISKLDAGVITPNVVNVNFGELIERLAREYQPRAAADGLDFRIAPRALHSNTDAVLVNRILRNLIENALRFTHKGGILVGVRQRGDRVRIDVFDTGMGVPDEQQMEIFEEFRQLNNPARDSSKGLGLGLAIVSRLVRLLGAELQVASRPDRGTRFSLLLPLAKTGPAVVAQVERIPDDPGGRILIIEDNVGLRQTYEMMLADWGYDTLSAENGAEALDRAALENWRFDAILADHRLGEGLTGAATAKEIARRANRRFPTTVITGDTAKERIAEVDASGFTMLHKPVEAHDLRRTLASLLGT